MNSITSRNAHTALPLALQITKAAGVPRNSRNGPVRTFDAPVTVVYQKPAERVVFWPERDANPFFHFFESLWMLGGRRDVKSVARYVKNMEKYSDDGETFHGAYGYRWRIGTPHNPQPLDQLETIIEMLRRNADERRAVLQMWDAWSDLGTTGKDVPCNLIVTFQVKSAGQLDMIVFNRSNDLVLGMLGANCVHMSYLHEYVARFAGYAQGTYYQVTANLHAYDETFNPLYDKMLISGHSHLPKEMHFEDSLHHLIEEPSPYEALNITPYPLAFGDTPRELWDASLQKLLRSDGRAPTGGGAWADPFFTDVAIPMMQAHDYYKDGEGDARYERALEMLTKVRAVDWAMAGTEWIGRRWKKFQDGAK